MNVKHSFLVRSSDGVSSYLIEMTVSSLELAVQCSCPAGIKGRLCKHKVHLLDNDVSILVDKQQEEDLRLVLSSTRDSASLIELQRYKEAELACNAASASFEQTRKRLERTLRGN